MNKATAKKTPKKAKPLRRAKRFGREVPRMALKMLMTLIAVVVMGLMFSALQAISTHWLRILLSLTIALGMLLLFFAEGLQKGVKDAGASRQCEQAQARGEAVDAKDDAACYHPLKAVGAAACVFAVPLALAAYLGATAQEYTYQLQDLPVWLTQSYGARGDVMAPLTAYTVTRSMHAADWIRILVRLLEMIYINLFIDPLRMSAMIDRLSALFIATYPLAYVLGYLRAPASAHKHALQQRRAKKIAVRRAQKKSLVEELVGEQHGVHYGQQAKTATHKRKELV